MRAAADESARASGLRIAAAGTHPFSLPQAQDIAPDPRYREFVEYAGITARRQAVCGLHVHVGMPGAEECMRALEGVLPWLPLVLALSANSPYLAGEETGLASARAEVLALLPRASAPPVFGSYAEWEAFVERFVEIGLADGYTRFWWDIRPAPALRHARGARARPADLGRDHGGPGRAAAGALRDRPRRRAACARQPRRLRAEPLGCSSLRAARAADSPDGDRLVGVEELTHELLALIEPAARELDSIESLQVLDPRTCEGDRQLEVGRERGLEAVAADTAERTLRSS